MNTKLTLSLDSTVIDRAKSNLQSKNKSLSGLIEDYFKLLIDTKTRRTSSTPVVKELTGIANIDKNADEKDIVTEYLMEKYR